MAANQMGLSRPALHLQAFPSPRLAGGRLRIGHGPSLRFQEWQFPWHLLIIGLFFALIKIPGPYYPYWGRIFLPHFANGGLWQTIWLAKNWYKKPFEGTEVESSSEIYSKSGSGSSEVESSSEVYLKSGSASSA